MKFHPSDALSVRSCAYQVAAALAALAFASPEMLASVVTVANVTSALTLAFVVWGRLYRSQPIGWGWTMGIVFDQWLSAAIGWHTFSLMLFVVATAVGALLLHAVDRHEAQHEPRGADRVP